MKFPHVMDTLSETMNSQREKGFTEDFMFYENKFLIKDKNKEYNPEDLTIVEVFRFEGMSDPSDMEVIYAIETNDGYKGLFIDAFGAYGAQDAFEVAESIKQMKILKNHSKE